MQKQVQKEQKLDAGCTDLFLKKGVNLDELQRARNAVQRQVVGDGIVLAVRTEPNRATASRNDR